MVLIANGNGNLHTVLVMAAEGVGMVFFFPLFKMFDFVNSLFAALGQSLLPAVSGDLQCQSV